MLYFYNRWESMFPPHWNILGYWYLFNTPRTQAGLAALDRIMEIHWMTPQGGIVGRCDLRAFLAHPLIQEAQTKGLYLFDEQPFLGAAYAYPPKRHAQHIGAIEAFGQRWLDYADLDSDLSGLMTELLPQPKSNPDVDYAVSVIVEIDTGFEVKSVWREQGVIGKDD